jgi:outer membrane autotransporter protein
MMRDYIKQGFKIKFVLANTLIASSIFITGTAEAILLYNPATIGLANALYNLAPANPTFDIIKNQLNALPTDEARLEALESLVTPFNNSMAVGSRIGMENVFDIVQIRIGDLHEPPLYRGAYAKTQIGNNYGDWHWHMPTFATWVSVMGGIQNQHERDYASGFNGRNAGPVVGIDFDICNFMGIGLAGSFDRMYMEDWHHDPKDQRIDSWQGTVYGWIKLPYDIYIDAIFGASNNHFKATRIIGLNQINSEAQASFDGLQMGFQSDIGMTYTSQNRYFSPFVRLKYFHLDKDDYAENGADILNLNVRNDHARNFIAGLGFRFSTIVQSHSSCVYFEPEFMAMLGYDFDANDENSYAGFAGTPVFPVDGFKQGRTVFNLDFGAHAHLTQQATLSLKYNLEVRDKFTNNAGNLQFYYDWL